MSLTVKYLVEARTCLLKIVAVYVFLFLVCWWQSESLIAWWVPFYGAQGMIITQLPQAILAPMNLSAFVAFLLSVPWVLLQVFQFVVPALYQDERQCVLVGVCLGTFLFYLGVLISIYWVVPWVFYSLTSWAPQGVQVWPDIQHTLSMVTQLHLVFGFVFETPLLMGLLVYMGWLSMEQITKVRPYTIIGCFTLGMLLTPPDVVSQVLVAIPLWLFIEAGAWVGNYLKITQKTP
ncbi:MAG TPA: twin-arginine translocase subunit TatC [Gammaproteobacteria bacterium]|nr:twin-arginine translocase subunit TatC [Gammaproteobacteria bacterium]